MGKARRVRQGASGVASKNGHDFPTYNLELLKGGGPLQFQGLVDIGDAGNVI